MALAKDINKIRDDVAVSEEKFVKESFLTSSEADKYIGALPGLKDILGAIESFISAFTDIVNAIKSLVQAVLSFIEGIVNLAAGVVNSVIEGLFHVVFGNLSGSGYSLEKRDKIYKYFNRACTGNLSGNFSNDLNSIALVGVLTGITCLSQGKTYSTTLDLFKSNPALAEKREEVAQLIDTRNNYANFDTDHNDIPELDNRIAILNNEIIQDEYAIDEMFAMATPDVLQVAARMPAMQVDDVVNLISDIADTSAGQLAGTRTPNLPAIALTVLNNSESIVVVNNPEPTSNLTATNDEQVYVTQNGEHSLAPLDNATLVVNGNRDRLKKGMSVKFGKSVYAKPNEKTLSLVAGGFLKETLNYVTEDSNSDKIVTIPKTVDTFEGKNFIEVIKTGDAFTDLDNGVVDATETQLTDAITILRGTDIDIGLDFDNDITPQVPADVIDSVNLIGKQNAMSITADSKNEFIDTLVEDKTNKTTDMDSMYSSLFVSPQNDNYILFSDYLKITNGQPIDSGVGVASIYPGLDILLLNRIVGGIVDKKSFIRINGSEDLVFSSSDDLPIDTTAIDADILTTDSNVINSANRFGSSVTERILLDRLHRYKLYKNAVDLASTKRRSIGGSNNNLFGRSNVADAMYDLSAFKLITNDAKHTYDTLMDALVKFNPLLDMMSLVKDTSHNVVFKLLSRQRLLSEPIEDINVITPVNDMVLLPAIVAQV